MKINTVLFSVFVLFIISCKKKETTTIPQKEEYRTTSAGSTWNYHQIDSSGATPVNSDFTLTSTSRDTSINARTYHIYSSSAGNPQYLNTSGSDYYQFDTLPATLGGVHFERLYLRDGPGGLSWTQSLTVSLSGISVPLLLTYNVFETGISRTVNGVNYKDVVHVTTAITSPLIPGSSLTTNINSYYAEKYGLIEMSNIIHLNFSGIVENVNTETKLVTATLL
jgi:hypothetical protein